MKSSRASRRQMGPCLPSGPLGATRVALSNVDLPPLVPTRDFAVSGPTTEQGGGQTVSRRQLWQSRRARQSGGSPHPRTR